MSTFKNVLMIAIVVFTLILGLSQHIRITKLHESNKELEKKRDELIAKVEELEYELSLDEEEYYKKMAEKNGYLDPDATHYTNDYSN